MYCMLLMSPAHPIAPFLFVSPPPLADSISHKLSPSCFQAQKKPPSYFWLHPSDQSAFPQGIATLVGFIAALLVGLIPI